MDLMWFLMLAHFVGDYALQSDAMARDKCRSRVVLTKHIAVYVAVLTATLWIYARVTDDFNFWTAAVLVPVALIFVIHWAQDYLKCRYFPNSKERYYQDQALHVIQLFVLRWWLL